MNCQVYEDTKIKGIKSPDFNFMFDKTSGFTATWGSTMEKDASHSPFGPMILDIEVSEVCHRGCKWCYKSNVSSGRNMSYQDFEMILDKIPHKSLTQVAFGIGDIDGNQDIFEMMKLCRRKGIIPNITINGQRMTKGYYDKLAEYCGAVAVSLYDCYSCYNAIGSLTDRGMKQVNIHCLLSEETIGRCYMAIEDALIDPRLSKLNAIVFLGLKQMGRGVGFHSIKDLETFKDFINFAIKSGVGIGFDSCTAPNFLKAVQDSPNIGVYNRLAEPCESTLMSLYINCQGIAYPCSFLEELWPGVNVLEANDFVVDVWNAKTMVEFRNKILSSVDSNGCRKCFVYDLEMK